MDTAIRIMAAILLIITILIITTTATRHRLLIRTLRAPAAPAPTYTAPAAPAASGSYYRPADYYLIAFNDHNIRAAQSYQVIGDQIEWMPKEGGPVQRAPLSTVDKAFSTQINRDRRIQFTLP